MPAFVLTGPHNSKVEVVPIQGKDGELPQALLRITGLDHPLAGVTFRAHREISTSNTIMWKVELEGGPYVVLSIWGQYPDAVNLQLPELGLDIKLSVDDFLSNTVDRDLLLADHRRRLADGSLAELARFHRVPLVAKKQKELSKAESLWKKTCGASLKVSMEWSSVPDEELADSNHCSALVAAATDICKRDEASKRAMGKQVKTLVCRRSDKTRLSLGADGVLLSEEAQKHTLPGHLAQAKLDAKPKLVALLKLRETVLRSEDGLVLVVMPEEQKKSTYAGRDGILYKQSIALSNKGFLAVLNGPTNADMRRKELGRWTLDCGDTSKEFIEASDAFGEELLAKAKRKPRLWKRELFALARDDRGIYYYVDKMRADQGGHGFRVFRGPRGSLKLTPLVDIVDDSDGMIFATTKGKLRLILDKKKRSKALWIEGKKERSLVYLSLSENKEFIFGDLGVYANTPYGSVCDL